MRKKRLTSLLLAVILAASTALAGCGDNKTEDTSAVENDGEENADEDEASKSDAQPYAVETKSDGTTQFYVVTNPNDGETLSYSVDGGMELVEETDGDYTYAFKDMNKNGELDVFEDWRLPVDERAMDLASKLSIDQIAGLMLFSSHERNAEEGLTDDQKKYLSEDNLRNVLNASGNNTEAAVTWNNAMQAYVESLGSEEMPIIPVNFSSDPRSTAGSGDQYMVDGSEISLWPSNLGMAATFDPETVFEFAQMSSEEYRGMGIATALGPQIDLSTDPRWLRVDGTFGEDTQLATDMTQAYLNGSQSSFNDSTDIGWDKDSINVMIKHFPGDGAGEGGRESHTDPGKYAVYPGNNYDEHLIPFVDGGLNLTGETKVASSVMSSYSVGINADGEPIYGEKKGSAYDVGKIDILRKDNNYDGVICTDWGVTNYPSEENPIGTAWGVQDLSVGERHYEILKTGVDMFGGNNDKGPVMEAYDLWQADFEAGELELSAEDRFRQSAFRLVKMIMLPKLMENPFLDMDESKGRVASQDKVDAGYQAQLDSVVMVKNVNETIKAADVELDYKDKVVYIPSSINYGFDGWFGPAETQTGSTMNLDLAKSYFKEVVTDTEITNDEGEVIGYETPDLSEVDMAIVGMRSINNGSNFTSAGLKDGKYYPLSLQYRPYTADGENVRQTSISGDTLEDGTIENRSYYGETSIIGNEYDLDTFLNTVEAVEAAESAAGKEIPVIVAMKAKNPVIMSEFEEKADAIVVGFSISDNALFDVILGKQEPQGLLPVQFPKDMDTVEAQFEDVAHDMEVYTDSQGNQYDFAFGLNYSGVIQDERTEKYQVK